MTNIGHKGAGLLTSERLLLILLNFPWITAALVAVIWLRGRIFPPLSHTYILAVLAGAATVARVAPTLWQFARPSPLLTSLEEIPARAAANGRTALGCTMLCLITLPWITPEEHRY